MKYTLALDPKATKGGGSSLASEKSILYLVGGMPDGDWASIANSSPVVGTDWQIKRRSADSSEGEWTGHYESAEDALAALQSEIDQTHP